MATSAWALPPEIFMEILEYLRPSMATRDHSEAWMTLSRYTNWWTVAAAKHGRVGRRFRKLPQPNVSMDLIRLRTVSREFYNMCTPLLYDEINIKGTYEELRDIEFPLILKYGRFIRTLRITIPSSSSPEDGEADLLLIQKIFPLTPHLSFLHLYLGSELDAGPLPPDYLETLHNSISWNTLQSFGVHSQGTYTAAGTRSMTDGILTRLVGMAPHKRKALRHLDIVNNFISQEMFDSIRSDFATLESLTIRRSLRFNGKIWDDQNPRKWSPNPNLTCLQLLDCPSVYPAHIPKILHLFPSLTKLLISACGNWDDVIPPARPEGWSRLPDALHHQPPHLEEFHIEHMVTWEILAMGEISSKTVIIAGVRQNDIEASFRKDPEIFPDLRHLRIDRRCSARTSVTETEHDENAATLNADTEVTARANDDSGTPPTSVPVKIDELKQVCRARGVKLTRDAAHVAFSHF